MADYKVSALKYRPQKFVEVVSQEFVTTTLKNAKLNNKIAHAYLLSGPRGIGKTTIARIFAKALNCADSKDGEPCNACESCSEITRGIHPDIFELDAASNRGIDDVRAIQDAAKFFPIKAKYKFFIVDEVHMLTIQAFNALLKILEEPPPYLIFILATTNAEKIPQTIISRCQRFVLHKLKVDDIREKLKEVAEDQQIRIDKESLFLISKLGDGALRDALGIFDMAVSYFGNDIKSEALKELLNLPDKESFFRISEAIKSGNTKFLIEHFSGLIDHGFDLQTFFNGLIEHFRNLLIVKTSSNPDLLDETDNIKKRYLTQTGEFTEGQILRFLKILFESETRFKYSNNQNILLETILIELCRVNKEITDVANLIEDLENLKKKTTELISGDTDKPEINLPIKIAPADIKKVSNENCDVNDMIDHLGLEEFTHN
jgi:DNA polymerase-3 subunit gamma/tau